MKEWLGPSIVALSLLSAVSGGVAVPQDRVAGETPARIGLLIRTSGPGAEIDERVRLEIQDFLTGRSHAGERTYELRVISANQRWGKQTGSIVDSIYRENTTILIGGPDQRSNHLAEQIISRSKGAAILISLACDPSLTQAGVPWVFRVAPKESELLYANLADFSADAALVAVEAMEAAQAGSDALRQYLVGREFRGKTGTFTFSEQGDRINRPPG